MTGLEVPSPVVRLLGVVVILVGVVIILSVSFSRRKPAWVTRQRHSLLAPFLKMSNAG